MDNKGGEILYSLKNEKEGKRQRGKKREAKREGEEKEKNVS